MKRGIILFFSFTQKRSEGLSSGRFFMRNTQFLHFLYSTIIVTFADGLSTNKL